MHEASKKSKQEQASTSSRTHMASKKQRKQANTSSRTEQKAKHTRERRSATESRSKLGQDCSHFGAKLGTTRPQCRSACRVAVFVRWNASEASAATADPEAATCCGTKTALGGEARLHLAQVGDRGLFPEQWPSADCGAYTHAAGCDRLHGAPRRFCCRIRDAGCASGR